MAALSARRHTTPRRSADLRPPPLPPTEPPPTESPPTQPRTPAIRLQHTCLGVASCVWPCRLYVACSVEVRSTALAIREMPDAFHFNIYFSVGRAKSAPTHRIRSDPIFRLRRAKSGRVSGSDVSWIDPGSTYHDPRARPPRVSRCPTLGIHIDPRNSHRTRFFGSAS